MSRKGTRSALLFRQMLGRLCDVRRRDVLFIVYRFITRQNEIYSWTVSVTGKRGSEEVICSPSEHWAETKIYIYDMYVLNALIGDMRVLQHQLGDRKEDLVIAVEG